MTELLRVREAADVVAVHRNRVYEWIAAGELEAVRIGRTVRVSRSALDAFIAERTVRSA